MVPKQVSKLIFFYCLFGISITFSMVQRFVYDPANGFVQGTTKFLWTTYSNTHRYCLKQFDPSVISTILGLNYNRQEDLKNKKVYFAMDNCIKLQQKTDSHPEGIPLQGPHINTEDCRIALSRGPLAANYLMDILLEKDKSDPYTLLLTSNGLLKNHGVSFLYGLLFIVSVGSNAQSEMKKKFLDDVSVDTTKLSLSSLLLHFLINHMKSINPDLLFQPLDKQSLSELIADLQTMYEKLPKKTLK